MATRAIKLPTNGMPRHWVLKQIMFPPPPTHFQQRTDVFGNTMHPLIPYAEQKEIHDACLMLGLDPATHLGITHSFAAETVQKAQQIATEKVQKQASASKAKKKELKDLSPEEQRILKRMDRQQLVEENMMKMGKIVAGYRKFQNRKGKFKPVSLPF